jgi:ABC-2 type transport system ATP-binding protein
MEPMVRTEHLRKHFGKTVAVSDLDLLVERGTVVGLIGPNGAGKSTILKILATLLRPSAGNAWVDGRSVSDKAALVRRSIGYMPDVSGLYEEMVVRDYLRFFCAVYGIKGAAAQTTMDTALSLTGLTDKADQVCGGLSRGMSQRLHLARVLLHDPALLLLDEPASGLDPRARIEFRDLVLTLRGMGKTLLISSHILSELGEVCDALVIIEKSRLVFQGTVADALGRLRDEGSVFEVVIQEDPSEGRTVGDLRELVRGLPYVDAVRDGEKTASLLIRFQKDFRDHHVLNASLVARGYRIERFAEQSLRLEDAFLHLTKGLLQ